MTRVLPRLLVAALMALTVLSSFGGAQGPTTAADLAIELVQIVGPAPNWVDESPTNTVVRAIVENRGEAPAGAYRINYQWVVNGQASWINGAETNSFDVQHNSLAPGTRATHEAPWRLQAAQRGAGQVRVSIVGGPDARTDNDAGSLAVFVPVHRIEFSVVGPAQGIHPDETRFLRPTLTNHGNVDETVTLGLLNASSGAAARLDEALESSALRAAPGENASTTLFVAYPFAGDTSTFAVSYDLTAATDFGQTLTARAAAFTSRYDPPPSASPLLLEAASATRLVAYPGNHVVVAFNLANLGVESDVFWVRASAASGWNASVDRDRIAPTAQNGIPWSIRCSGSIS